VSFQPVVHYNDIYLTLIGRAVLEICSRRGQTHRRTSVRYLTLIGIVAFIVQLQLLHLLRYHKTISILGTTLASAMWNVTSTSERREKSREKGMSLAMWTSRGARVTIPSLSAPSAMWDLISFGFVMGIVFLAFTTVIYLLYHDLAEGQ